LEETRWLADDECGEWHADDLVRGVFSEDGGRGCAALPGREVRAELDGVGEASSGVIFAPDEDSRSGGARLDDGLATRDERAAAQGELSHPGEAAGSIGTECEFE